MDKVLITPPIEEEDEERNKVVDLRLIQGGKEPPSGGENWLQKLDVGACFLVKDKTNPMEFNLGLFRIAEKTDKAVVLQTPHVPQNLYVDPISFCNKYRIFEDLGKMIAPKDVVDDSNRIEPDTPGETENLDRPPGE